MASWLVILVLMVGPTRVPPSPVAPAAGLVLPAMTVFGFSSPARV